MRLGIRAKIAAVIAAMGIVQTLGLGYAAYASSYRHIASQYTDLARAAAESAAAAIDGGSVDGYLQNGEDDEYRAAHAVLCRMKAIFGFEYLYVIRPDPETDSCLYVFDIYTEGSGPPMVAGLGEQAGEDEFVHEKILGTYLTGQTESGIITDTAFGWLASAYAPVFASDGSVAAVVGADISMNRILGDILAQSVRLMLLGAAVIAAGLFALLFLAGRIAGPIVRLSRHMGDFGSDGAPKDFEVGQTGDELQTMAESFNRMAGDIRLYMQNLAAMTYERERVAAELSVAAGIQAAMLPSTFPAFPERFEFDIYADMRPAKEVGGDFYDFFMIDKDTLGVVIADVSDKGVPAALFMALAKTLIKSGAQEKKSPKEVFESVNRLLSEGNETGMFVTAFLGCLDIPTGKFVFANAGHNPPLLFSGGVYRRLASKAGFVLAGMENTIYREGEITLQPGDGLLLYTDGVTEAANPDGELFGERRLIAAADRYAEQPPKAFVEAIKAEIDGFATGAPQADDITMLALRYIGKAHVKNELKIEAVLENMDAVLEFVDRRLEGCPAKIQNQMGIVADEIFSNIARYAYAPGVGEAIIRICIDGEYLTMEFEDFGKAYDPTASPDPDMALPAMEREIGGLGVFMVKKIMDAVEYRRENGKNTLTLKKKIM